VFELPTDVVDCWINPNIYPPDPTKDVGYLFGQDLADRLTRGTTLDQLVEEMDAAGVARGILCSGYSGEGDREWCTAARDRFPDRFALSHVVDPREGMQAVRLVGE
jgi:hypothetical protein